MRISQILRQSATVGAALTACFAFTTPAVAHDEAHADIPPPPAAHAGPRIEPAAREAWLADCHHRLSRRDNGLGGALIGGLIGGGAGYGIGGRRHRTAGTLAGAAIGAAAGAIIDKAEDRGGARDECEAYLENYEAHYSQGYASTGHGSYAYGHPGHGYSSGCCMQMVPVMHASRGERECTETVEYVYEDVPVRPVKRRYIPQKRVKRVPVN